MSENVNYKKKKYYILMSLSFSILFLWFSLHLFDCIYYYQKLTGELQNSYTLENCVIEVKGHQKYNIIAKKMNAKDKVSSVFYVDKLRKKKRREDAVFIDFNINESGKEHYIRFYKMRSIEVLFHEKLIEACKGADEKRCLYIESQENMKSLELLVNEFEKNTASIFCANYHQEKVCFFKRKGGLSVVFPDKSYGIITFDLSNLRYFEVEFLK